MARGLAAARSSHEFVLAALPEREQPDSARYGDLPAHALRWPRAASQVSWVVSRRPRIRRVGGPIDILHVTVPIGPVPTDRALVVTVHDLMPLTLPEAFGRRARWLYRQAIATAKARADRIIVCSGHTRDLLVSQLDVPTDRIVVIPEGVPPDARPATEQEMDRVFQRHGLTRQNYVLFLGEVGHRKNSTVLVEAFAELAESQAAVQLVLVGSPGIGFRDVKERIQALGMAGRIKITGHVPRDDVAPLISGAMSVVLPSADEGFGFPALEAMACGTPVIVSDAGSLPEVVGAGGLVVAAGDSSALADAMRCLAVDPSLRSRTAALGRQRSGEFSWERTARETIKVYEAAHRIWSARGRS